MPDGADRTLDALKHLRAQVGKTIQSGTAASAVSELSKSSAFATALKQARLASQARMAMYTQIAPSASAMQVRLPTVRIQGFDAMPTYSPALQAALDLAGDDALGLKVEDIPGLSGGMTLPAVSPASKQR